MFDRLRAALVHTDPTYDRWAGWHQPSGRKSVWVTMVAHVLINFGLVDWVPSLVKGAL